MRTVYRLLLALLPARYDECDRAEMLETFEARVAASGARGSGVGTQLVELADLARTVVRSRQPSGLPESFVRDLRLGVRGVIKSPMTSTLAVVSLALGLGATSAIYSCLDVWLIRPLPLPDAERLVGVAMANRERGWNANVFSPRDLFDWRDEASTVELAGYRSNSAGVAIDGSAQRVRTLEASGNLLWVLGLEPIAGRGLHDEDEVGGAVAMVSQSFAIRFAGGVAAAVGAPLLLDGERYTVVGVLPPVDRIPEVGADIWLPLRLSVDSPRAGHSIRGVARLADGVPLAAARDELQAVAAAVADSDPERTFPDAWVVPWRDAIYGDVFAQAGTVLGGAVLFVLLIACANIANLLLARGASRSAEMSVRSALGAGRGRIVRQLLTESLVLAGLGGVVGLGVGKLGIHLLTRHVLPADMPGAGQIGLDLRVVAVTAVLTTASAFVFGLVPALRTARMGPRERTGGGAGAGRRTGFTARSLVVVEVTLSLGLLAATGLLIGSLVRLRAVDLGFRVDESLTFSLYVPPATAEDAAGVASLHRRVSEEIAALPGVEGVAAASGPPIGGWSTLLFSEPGEDDPARRRSAENRLATERYQRLLEMEMAAGRWFDDQVDGESSPNVAVVSRSLAELQWGTAEAAIGRTVELVDGDWTIVGVVDSGRVRGPQQSPPLMIFRSLQQVPSRNRFYVVTAAAGGDRLLELIRARIDALAPGLAVDRPATLRELLRQQLMAESASLQMLATLAGIALVLTLVGVYGVVAHTVRRRVSEMGIRLALGASSRSVLVLVLRQSLGAAALGLVLGSGIALLLGRGLASFLSGVRPGDPVALAAAVVAMTMAVLAASYLPARRASRVDPSSSLRDE